MRSHLTQHVRSRTTVFGPDTTEADLVANISAATKALMTPLVESTALPAYRNGLRGRITDETGWLRAFSEDGAKQAAMCGFMGASSGRCVAFTVNMQSAKIQALQVCTVI